MSFRGEAIGCPSCRELALDARVRVVGWALVDTGQMKPWLEEVQVGLGLNEVQAWVLGWMRSRWSDGVMVVTEMWTVWCGGDVVCD